MNDGFQPFGLYDPSDEHDACGVGFIAAIDGQPRRRVLDMAIEALGNLKHRGAVDADGKTGDGAGVMTQVPAAFLARETGITEPFAVGMIFMPAEAQAQVRDAVETEAARLGHRVLGWRQVPVRVDVIGDKALQTLPDIWQVFISSTNEAKLYVLRRAIERRMGGAKGFYICSFSGLTIVYKGLFLAEQTAVFYPDLRDPDYISSFAIFHQRYSTNTAPAWPLAQPFRMLAHNGEINTLRGNLNWMKVHETRLGHPDFDDHLDVIRPVVTPGGSDSSALDAVFDLMCRAGRPAPMVKSMLVPEAYMADETMPQHHKDFYLYCNSVIEPWDGPAALAMCDGRWLLGGMDRNGLRPFRYALTEDGYAVAGSEAGLVQLAQERVSERGCLGPGQMIAIDLAEGRLYKDREIKDLLAARQPFGDWVRHGTWFETLMDQAKRQEETTISGDELRRLQLSFGQTQEDIDLILRPMAVEGKEAVGSMGDDTPLAALSDQYRPMSHFFRQNFAQVTNPPIDSLREKRVMSLYTRLGNLGNILDEDKTQCQMLAVQTPLLFNAEIDALKEFAQGKFAEIDSSFALDETLGDALGRLRAAATDAARAGAKHLIVSDQAISAARCAIPAPLAVAAVQTHLVAEGLRSFVSLNIRTAEAMDTHAVAVLIGLGATTVNPWLTQEVIGDQLARGLYGADATLKAALKSYRKAIGDGLLKIMAKMGIAVVSSYRGGCNFEAIGLSKELVGDYFPDVTCRLSGVGLEWIEARVRDQHRHAYDPMVTMLPQGGFYRIRARSEQHAWEADAIDLLQRATARNDRDFYDAYVTRITRRHPLELRDLLDFRKADAIPLETVEPMEAIRTRFITPAMSLGALSYEAHGTLNIAMNRIGARSNSGEGGEDPARYRPMPNGDNANSAIKQISTGRFGVTARYLNEAREIEIKMSQGAKPGEGGQLPGFKVTEMIARLRHSTPGVTLISPPPHHDIYSIEDLAQLIYDLKQINDSAKICVKLVARSGIGTIAAGVAKAKADIIQISGHAGGTGASPQTSVKFAGAPWEMGLAEANQVLVMNGLRDRVTLRTDGGIKTGRDIVIAALLGAEEYGIGTASLVALGCIMVRQCHSNTCPVGVCTQDERLREMYTGAPEKLIALMDFLADDVRRILSELGVGSLNDIIGRTDLLDQARGHNRLDLARILTPANDGKATRCTQLGRTPVADTLDQQIQDQLSPLFDRLEPVTVTTKIRNVHRSVGTYTSGRIVRAFGDEALPDGHLTLKLHGTAGQSLGAFGAKGLRIDVTGEANDYVGKGLSGAIIAIAPFVDGDHSVIIGNTVLYGATSGFLFAAGHAGERFAVRNSGAHAVIEGCGTNGCEYMTGGVAVILGPVGANFAAGMTGGEAFVHDREGCLPVNLNDEFVTARRVEDDGTLRALVERHALETGSARAIALLADWENELPYFWRIAP